jgi:phenylacetate-CoA ligase
MSFSLLAHTTDTSSARSMESVRVSANASVRTLSVHGSGMQLAADIEALSREDLLSLAERNLANLVARISASPILMKTYPGLAAVRSLDDLARVVPHSAADLSANGPPESDAYLFDGEEAGLVLASGGTSSREKFLYHSWIYNEQICFLGARGLRSTFRGSRPRRLLNCSNFAHLYGSGLFMHELGKHVPARTYPLGSGAAPERVRELVERHAIDTIVATPKALTSLFRSVPPGSMPSLRNALYQAGAMLEEDAALIRSHGVTLRAASYASTETGPIGYQCPECSSATYHVHEDAFRVEIVDPNTLELVPAGASGEVVVTSFSDTGMALLRYRLGDRGRLLTQRCACGSPTMRLALEGRTDWGIEVDGTTITEGLLLSVLQPAGVRAPEEFQLYVAWTGPTFSAELRIDLGSAPEATPDFVRELVMRRDNLRRRFSPPTCARFEVVRCDGNAFLATPTGKRPCLYQTS